MCKFQWLNINCSTNSVTPTNSQRKIDEMASLFAILHVVYAPFNTETKLL